MMGTWSRIYDVGDLEDVVRGSSIVSSTDDVSSPHKDLVKRSECCMEKGVTQLSKNHAPPLKLDEERPTILSPTQGHMNDSSLSPNKGVHSNSATVKIEPNVNSLPRLPGIRRRKSQQRRIMCVPAVGGLWNKHGGGGVSSDLWAWRKYGQKPIKGSPYPRGYYRCSSSKGCPARKQIERSHTDPTLLVITYTAEHNHAWPASRNALARSSRQNVLQHNNNNNSNNNNSSSNNNNTHELSVPNTAQLHHSPSHKSALAPQSQSHSHSQEKMEISCVQNQEDDNDCVGIDQDLGFRADHDLFAGLAELPELYPNDFTIHSDEEAASSVIDPFNLFNWPPLVNTTVTPNS